MGWGVLAGVEGERSRTRRTRPKVPVPVEVCREEERKQKRVGQQPTGAKEQPKEASLM